VIYGLKFPGIGEVLVWPNFNDNAFGFNKIALINVIAMVLTVGIFLVAGSKRKMVPAGIQNFTESSIDFVRTGIAEETMGKDGRKWVPFLCTMFFFIFFNNITGIIPVFQMPATARIALPLVLALTTYFAFNIAGVIKQGPLHYLGANLFPPGVPKILYVLITPIEFISTFLVRPFSLAVRLFANMLAGHLMLVTFAVLADALMSSSAIALKPMSVLPFAMLVIMTGFEVLVSFLQAYIFTILTGVYIAGAVSDHH
jgi:F-type H+-transporting ATPase subunit a